jgi:hypothetical protein
VRRCDFGDRRTATLFFAAGSRLLYRRDVEDRGGLRSTLFDDHRLVVRTTEFVKRP